MSEKLNLKLTKSCISKKLIDSIRMGNLVGPKLLPEWTKFTISTTLEKIKGHLEIIENKKDFSIMTVPGILEYKLSTNPSALELETYFSWLLVDSKDKTFITVPKEQGE